jgi:hypothetical protein
MPVGAVIAAPCGAAGEVDDRAAGVLSQEGLDRFAAEGGRRDQGNGKHPVPRGGPVFDRVLDRGRLVDSGVVDEHVDAPPPGQRVLPQAWGFGGVGQIAGHGMAALAQLGVELGKAAAWADVVDDDLAAACCDGRGGGRSDATRSAGDEDNAVGEVDHGVPIGCAPR